MTGPNRCAFGWVWGWIVAGVCLLASCAWGQDEATHTLHVYVNTVQVPVLVLGPSRERLKKPMDAGRFYIALDKGPLFQATHVRREGEDRISLAIVLDATGGSEELMRWMKTAVGGLAPKWLHEQDQVTLYATDCYMLRRVKDVPADAGKLQEAVDKVLEAAKGGCKRPHLWDALLHVTSDMKDAPGRKVMLVVTDGQDDGSRYTWNELRMYAQSESVTIFGLMATADWWGMRPGAGGRPGPGAKEWTAENDWDMVCELTGGMLQSASESTLDKVLQQFATMLRERYIVEFPRPYQSTKGVHTLDVTITKTSDYFIRPGGVTVQLQDPKTLQDPDTVASDPAKTPQLGKRKILTPQ